MSFDEDIQKFIQKVEKRADFVVYITTLGLLEEVVQLSPYGQWEQWSEKWQRLRPRADYVPGHLLSCWDYSQNGAYAAETSPFTTVTPDAAFEDVGSKVKLSGAASSDHWLSNSANYAADAEAGILFLHRPNASQFVERTMMIAPYLVETALVRAQA